MNNILTDLDDFLAPSLECIKMIHPEDKKKPGGGEVKAQVQISNDFEEEEYKVQIHTK